MERRDTHILQRIPLNILATHVRKGHDEFHQPHTEVIEGTSGWLLDNRRTCRHSNVDLLESCNIQSKTSDFPEM